MQSSNARHPRADSAAAAPWDATLGHAVAALRVSREVTHNIRQDGRIRPLPSTRKLIPIIDKIAAALFPTHCGTMDLDPDGIDCFVDITLREALDLLHDQVRRDILSSAHQDELASAAVDTKAAQIVRDFAKGLPAIRDSLVSDLMAAYAGDPAALSYAEVMLGYPGMTAVLHHRIAHALYRLDAKLLARLVSQIAHSRTAIDIHPAATIGDSFFIDHGTGVVIGETTIIGDRVRLYQAVTLGAKRFQADDSGMLVKGNARHPIVEDDVVIYAGATVLGRITIGRGSVIGGNVWLTRDVPPHSSITQGSTRRENSLKAPARESVHDHGIGALRH